MTASQFGGFLFLCVLALPSCAVRKGTINSYVDPSYSVGSIKKVAVFSVRNAGRAPAESRDINAKITRALAEKNPQLQIIAPTEALRKVNEAGIAHIWARFVEDLDSSGIANKQYLQDIATALDVDAVVQGQVTNIRQNDGDNWGIKGATRITVGYSIVEVDTAKMVWEASADGIRINGSSSGEAPPIVEAIMLAVDKVIENIPSI